MAAPTYRSTGNLAYGGARTTSSVPVPTGVATNDVIIVHIYTEDSAPTVTPPSGFTEITFSTTPQTTAAAGVQRQRVFWKRATGADSGTYAFTHTSVATEATAAAFSGCITSGTPLEVLGSAIFDTGNTAPPAVSGTTTAADEMLVYGTTNYNFGTTLGVPSGFTVSANAGSSTLTAYKAQTTAGATGSVTATNSGSTSNFTATLIGLKSASAAVTATPNTIATGQSVPNPTVSTTIKSTPSGSADNVSAFVKPTSASTPGLSEATIMGSGGTMIGDNAHVESGTFALKVTPAASSGVGFFLGNTATQRTGVYRFTARVFAEAVHTSNIYAYVEGQKASDNSYVGYWGPATAYPVGQFSLAANTWTTLSYELNITDTLVSTRGGFLWDSTLPIWFDTVSIERVGSVPAPSITQTSASTTVTPNTITTGQVVRSPIVANMGAFDLHTEFLSKANASAPSVGDEGQAISYTPAADLTVTSGMLTGCPAGSGAARYVYQNLPLANRIGVDYRVGAGNTSSGSILIGLFDWPSSTARLHVYTTPTTWAIQLITAGTVFVTLATGNYTTPLAQDWTGGQTGTLYRLEALLAGTTVTVNLPDGTSQQFTDSRFTSQPGDSAVFEFYRPTSDSPDLGIARMWADSTIIGVSAGTIPSGQAVPSPAVSTTVTTVPGAVASGEVVPNPVLTIGGAPTPTVVTPDPLPDGASVFLPTLINRQLPVPDSIDSAASVPTPVLRTQVHAYWFVPPRHVRRVPIAGSLIGEYLFGVAVMRINGEWVENEFPTEDQFNSATEFYTGGSLHRVSAAKAAELAAAGYDITEEYIYE